MLTESSPKSFLLLSLVTCPLIFFLGFGIVSVTVERNSRYFASLGVLAVCLIVNLAFLVIALGYGVFSRQHRESRHTWLTIAAMIVYSIMLGKIGGH